VADYLKRHEAMNEDRIRQYYSQNPDSEWQRLLDVGGGAIEFELTRRLIERHVPGQARVLDIGGGPGRYTVYLAGRGRTVVLADLVPELLDFARQQIAAANVGQNVEEVVVADACDLSRWDPCSFDAVLALGPFYHLTDPGRRATAAREIATVLRPGGVMFAAFMPRLVFIRRAMLVPQEWRHLRDQEFVRRVLEDGVFRNDNPGRFDEGYGARPEEVAPFFEHFGFQSIALIAAEGIAPVAYAELIDMAASDPGSYAAAIDVLESTASEPSVLGAASHLLYVGRKR
jgi:SAM-dependent methyltransferase